MEPTRQELLAENTELKRRLQQAEATFEAKRTGSAEGKLCREILLQAVPAIAICDQSGRITEASRGLHDLCGQNPLLFPFHLVFPLKLPDNRTFLLAPLFQGENLHNIEANFRQPGGRIVHVLVNVGPLLTEGAEIEGYVVAFTDITDRKEAETGKQKLLEELQQREEELQALNEELQVLNEELRVMNEELLSQADELRFQTVRLHARNDELQVLTKKLHVQTVELEKANREILTAHKALQESREDLNRAQAVAHTGSWRLDVRQNKLTWSDEAHRIFGIPQGTSMSYETFLAAVHPEDREYVNQNWLVALKGEPYDIEHRIVVNDTVKWVRERAELEFDTRGRLLGGFGTTQDITERQQAEEALRESEERLRQAAQAGRMFAFEWDPETDAVKRSPEAGLILGLSGDAALHDHGQDFFGKIYPADRAPFIQKLHDLNPGADRYIADYRIIRADNGQVVWLEEIAHALFDAQGRMHRLYGMTMDVTEGKEAEAALQTAHIRVINEKNRLEAVMQTLPVGVAILDEQGGNILCNPMFEEVWGSPRPVTAEIKDYQLYKAWWLDTGKQVQPEEWASAQAVQQGETVIGQLMEIERFDGGRRYVINSGAPIRDADGKITGCAVAIFDITEHRRAEEALRESEGRYRSLVELSPDAILVCTEGKYVFANQAAARLFGAKTPTDMVGQDVLGLAPPEDREFVERRIKEVLAGDREEQQEAKIMRLDGQSVDVEASAQAIGYQGRQSILLIFRDITERKQAEAALRLSNQRLDLLAESANRLLASEVPQKVVASICPKVMEFLDCDMFFNFLRDEQEGRLHLNAWAGIPAEEAKRIEWLDYGVAVCGCAARDGCRIVAEDIQTTADVRTELVKSYGIQAYACQPLMSQGRVLGTLSFGTRRRSRFTKDELALMQAVADQVAVAMERKLFVQALWNSRERERLRVMEMEAILEAVPVPIFLSRDSSGRSITGNPTAYKFLQLTPGCNLSLAAPGGERPHYKARQDGRELPQQELPMQRALTGQKVHDLEYDLILPDGRIRHISANAVPLLDLAGRPQGAVGVFMDLTERKQAHEALRRAHDELEDQVRKRTKDLQFTVTQLQEEVLERLRAEEKAASIGRLYRFLSRVNETIVRSRDPEDLFEQTCRIAVEEGGFRMAWIGLLDQEDLLIKPKACHGLEQGYLKNLVIPVADVPEGRGPTGTAIREGKCDVCHDFATDPRMAPWRQSALERGYESSAAFPVLVGSQVIGAITLYADRAGFFTEAEVGLLNSLSQDLSFALESMDREAKRLAAEEKIRQLNAELEERVQRRTGQLFKAVEGLEQEIAVRQQAQEALRQAHDELEERVRQRTKELQFTVAQLQEEVLERQRAEAELTKQTKLVYDLYNKAPCGYHSLDPEGRFVRINDTELAWLGYRREEVVGRMSFADLLTAESQQRFRQNFPGFVERDEVYDLEYQMIRKDRTVFPVLLSATAVRDEAGNFLMSRGTIFDLTARVQAEAALASERQRLFQVLEQLPAYVLLLAPDYTVSYANREFIQRFGMAAKGQRCYEFLFGRDNPCEHCQTYRVLETNAGQEWEWQGPDGRNYAVFDYPFTDVDGSPLILELGLDITARRRAEQDLRESEERLRFLANQLLTSQEQERKRLASELHDELGHALLTLKLSLGAIGRKLLPEQENVRELLQEQLEYVSHVIEEVRRLYYDLSPGDLEDLGLTKALESLVEDFGSHQPDIGFRIDLPELAGRLSLQVQTIIYRLVQEALTNIGKHAEPTQVNVSAQKENGRLCLVIEDDGRGFDLSQVDRDPHRGLGLAAMRERLYIVGGSLEIWSKKGQGTRLTFMIPILPEGAYTKLPSNK